MQPLPPPSAAARRRRRNGIVRNGGAWHFPHAVRSRDHAMPSARRHGSATRLFDRLGVIRGPSCASHGLIMAGCRVRLPALPVISSAVVLIFGGRGMAVSNEQDSAATIGAITNGQVKKLQRPLCLWGIRGGARDPASSVRSSSGSPAMVPAAALDATAPLICLIPIATPHD